jgi:predicted nucleic acid-binding protein
VSCVIDASVTLSWFFEDERTAKIDQVLDRVEESGATVPGLWRLEVANAFQMAHRRGRVSAAFRDQALGRLEMLPIAVDLETDSRVWKSSLPLADKHSLSVYDAAYLQLAVRLALPLASCDRDLCEAAKRAGVPLIATI